MMLMHDKEKASSKSEPVANGMVESSCSMSRTLNKIMFFSLGILSLISEEKSRLLVGNDVAEVVLSLANFSRTEAKSCSRVNLSCFSWDNSVRKSFRVVCMALKLISELLSLFFMFLKWVSCEEAVTLCC